MCLHCGLLMGPDPHSSRRHEVHSHAEQAMPSWHRPAVPLCKHKESADRFSSKELRNGAKLLARCHWACGLHLRQCSFGSAVVRLIFSAWQGAERQVGARDTHGPLSKNHSCPPTCVVPLPAGVDSSCKTMFVIALLKELIEAGHRALIFSQSRVMLDILQAAIQDRGYAFCRIDGSIASTTERQVPQLCPGCGVIRLATVLHKAAIKAACATWPAADGADGSGHSCSHYSSLLMPTLGTTCAAAARANKIRVQSLSEKLCGSSLPVEHTPLGTRSACCLRPGG